MPNVATRYPHFGSVIVSSCVEFTFHSWWTRLSKSGRTGTSSLLLIYFHNDS